MTTQPCALLLPAAVLMLLAALAARADTVAEPACPIRIVAFGDSTTAPREGVVVYADRLPRELAARGLDAELINAGVPGNNTEDARKRFVTDVLDRHPDVVLLQFGINDSAIDVWRDPPETEPRISRARFKENITFFLDELAARGIRAILMTPNPMRWAPRTRELYNQPPYNLDDPDGFNVLLRDYAEAVREIAAEWKVPLVDVYAAFQDFGAKEGQSMDDLLLDGMHPNDTGHALVTGLLVDVIAAPGGQGQPRHPAPEQDTRPSTPPPDPKYAP